MAAIPRAFLKTVRHAPLPSSSLLLGRSTRCAAAVEVQPQQPPRRRFSEWQSKTDAPELVEYAAERDRSIRTQHHALNTDFPAQSLPPGQTSVDALEVRRKRLVYRSKQRGWLEVDLLMGTWAVENVPTLTVAEMDEYEAILNQETIDIFNFVTGKDEAPEEIQGAVLDRLQEWAQSAPLGSSPGDYAEAKKVNNMT